MRIPDSSEPDQMDPITRAVRDEWPIHARTFPHLMMVPPVREGGHTAALIDLAVQMARGRIAAEIEAYRDLHPISDADGGREYRYGIADAARIARRDV